MDPLTTLSLAGNIIQFVDFGTKLFSEARQLYNSSVGSLKSHDEIELITNDVKALVKNLQQAFAADTRGVQNYSANYWENFRKICDEAVSVAEDLLELLKELKLVPSGKRLAWSSVQVALRSLWSEKKIAAYIKRLAALKDVLESRVLFSIRCAVRTSARFDCLDRQTQRIISAMLGQHTAMSKAVSGVIRDEITALTITLSQILSRREFKSEDDHLRTRQIILQQLCQREHQSYPSGGDIVAGIEMLQVSDTQENRLRDFLQRGFIRSLWYEEMTHRYEDIVEAHPETYEWAFHDPPQDAHSWSSLYDWLKTGRGVYWVSGKAGSGKSTLMKHLFDDPRMKKCLEAWAADTPLCITTYFFWNSGTRMQKSQLGFLRALLFQVLQKHPDLIPVVFPIDWATLYSKNARDTSKELGDLCFDLQWNPKSLIGGFRALASQKTIPLKICFLIDGLDEFLLLSLPLDSKR
ncbi:uncharacterized protein LY89DRAFT_788448 [Mollisia scopiformis]|uniref:Nephrocystin 3-like N-terminal domain-containing protein n=1 Tax=Mollisia scopiformis TaxID=149040 RepID=A0A132BB12_MOLSC|nr:uncharacterized protein LY89DRAFT_788448 [Mollisia scopiformis]KUJ09034.1 hypothetical protein LY89DRAFT_788448 [Mollisia scopiformis]